MWACRSALAERTCTGPRSRALSAFLLSSRVTRLDLAPWLLTGRSCPSVGGGPAIRLPYRGTARVALFRSQRQRRLQIGKPPRS
jgi:hypothetical protein